MILDTPKERERDRWKFSIIILKNLKFSRMPQNFSLLIMNLARRQFHRYFFEWKGATHKLEDTCALAFY